MSEFALMLAILGSNLSNHGKEKEKLNPSHLLSSQENRAGAEMVIL
jgi:hypothetical protein